MTAWNGPTGRSLWHVADSYAPKVGGIETHVAALAAHQVAAGHRVRVVTLAPAGDTATSPQDGVEVTRLAAGETGLSFAGLAGLVDHLRHRLRHDRPDVVHVHASVLSPLAAAAIRAAHEERVPALVTVHSLWADLGPLPWLVRHGLRLHETDTVWSAVSRVAADAVAPLAAPREVHVLPNAVDPDAWTSLAAAALARTSFPEADPDRALHLVAVMRLTRVKRAVPLVEVLHRVREQVPAVVPLRATIAGDGPQRRGVEARLRRHGMDWVSLPGSLDRPAVRALLADADVFLAPAHRESFGIAPLEARSSGVPVVAPAASGVTEFLRPGLEGLLASDDIDMAAQVTRLCTDPALRARMVHHDATTPPAFDWQRARQGADVLYARAAALVGVPLPAAPLLLEVGR
ncbi:glycosyltransferase family 4 protein [Nocardioides bruguierae]|uniref:glycosyltransferase family 4 protein n=1 Tax=Nocardioides bruguierae TaxID=2945102 RepID=UPI0020201ECC|nr:glycosyltransferase family 4 protein [Nocardioides bruguierae]MCL8024885.1 glycosyltransferase family 4 protein [Nocardioides bruguierae]